MEPHLPKRIEESFFESKLFDRSRILACPLGFRSPKAGHSKDHPEIRRSRLVEMGQPSPGDQLPRSVLGEAACD